MNKPTFGTYRGWSIQDNEWVYGWRADNCIIPSTKHAYDYTTQERFVEVTDCIEVHPESLAMFKGLYDNTDKKKPIYASVPLPDGSMSKGGDIIRVVPREWSSQPDGCSLTLYEYLDQNYAYNQYIVFRGGAFYGRSLSLNKRDGQYDYYDIARTDGVPEYYSVQIIGNGYENPELLESES